MPSRISWLRYWFALGAILMIATVSGMYFYARWSLRKAVHSIPAKIGLDIQQTADGFSISKSVEGRTLFRVSASKAVQFKDGGRAELHNVKIVVYGKDSARFDQIAGDDFEYDPTSGNINARGRVLIDLQANPGGSQHSDQSPPEPSKDPIHLETNGLVFNKNTGDASASGKVTFQTPQATGSAVGIEYLAKTGVMNLLSSVELTVNKQQPIHLIADRGLISKEPHQVFLTSVHMNTGLRQMRSDEATFFLRPDNTVERVLAEGDVESEFEPQPKSNSKASGSGPSTSKMRERSDRAELFLSGTRNLLTNAVLSGNVQVASQPGQNTNPGGGDRATQPEAEPVEAFAGRVTLHFAGEQVLTHVHAESGVRLLQKNNSGGVVPVAATGSAPKSVQDIEMTAPVMDFVVKNGRLLDRADTTGPPQIRISQPASNQRTVVTAAKFTARFTEKNRLATLHGEPDAKIVSGLMDKSVMDKRGGAPPQSERVSTSKVLDVVFLPDGGVSSITQSGSLAYTDGEERAWAQRGQYTTGDQLLLLTGSPRVVNGGMTTTAQAVRMNRNTGDAMAEGNVKSTYSELKAQPDGGMLSSSDPIHVTSQSMTAKRSSAIAVYSGDARLWQNANLVEAPTLQFDRDHRSLVAQGAATQPVSTVLMQVDKSGKATPIHVTSSRLNYDDVARRIFLNGGVIAKDADATLSGEQMTVFLLSRSQMKVGSGSGSGATMPGQVEKIIVERKIVITEPTRRATGEKLVYTAADDKFVLTGGTPSIYDAERGKTTGDSLTFYRHDDRVLVEGKETSPAVTRTQVAR